VDDLLVVRGLGSAVEPLRRYLIAAGDVLRPRLVGRRALPPTYLGDLSERPSLGSW
jgi:hypothetical protein